MLWVAQAGAKRHQSEHSYEQSQDTQQPSEARPRLADAGGHGDYPLKGQRIPLPAEGPIRLRAEVDFEHLYFSWASQGDNWQRLPLKLDYSVLSDEAGTGAGNNFTGAFVGMAAQDLSGAAMPADFAGFEYREG